jgi:hypothetical protein
VNWRVKGGCLPFQLCNESVVICPVAYVGVSVLSCTLSPFAAEIGVCSAKASGIGPMSP